MTDTERFMSSIEMISCPEGRETRILEKTCLKLQNLPARRYEDEGKLFTVIKGVAVPFRPHACNTCDRCKSKPKIKPQEVKKYKHDIRPGQVYSYLTVVKKVITENRKNSYWTCICECGEVINIRAHSLATGRTKSCGCITGRKRRY